MATVMDRVIPSRVQLSNSRSVNNLAEQTLDIPQVSQGEDSCDFGKMSREIQNYLQGKFASGKNGTSTADSVTDLEGSLQAEEQNHLIQAKQEQNNRTSSKSSSGGGYQNWMVNAVSNLFGAQTTFAMA